jgi:predicted GIY-YIG superfamily endonuclease
MSSNPVKSGIYCIENTVDGKRYYGQAKNLARRFKEHRGALKAGRHCNPKLQNAYRKYGVTSFVMRILEECSVSELNIKEQKLLDIHADTEMCYNLSKEVQFTTRGLKASNEKKAKMSAALGFRKKIVEQRTLAGELLHVYESMADASRETKVPRPNIIACCKGRLRSAGGFLWTPGVTCLLIL